MEDTLIQFGPYILPFPVALATILTVFYSLFNKPDGTNPISDRIKNGFALIMGVGFGILVMTQKGVEPSWINFIGWGIFGLLEGAAAVGLYKSVRVQSGK